MKLSSRIVLQVIVISLSMVLFSCNAKTARKAEEVAKKTKKTYEEYKVAREKYPGIRVKEKQLREEVSDTWNQREEKRQEKRYVNKICGQCGGGGLCYSYDSYGNLVTDIYGTPLAFTCPVCMGSGMVVVEEYY